MTEPSGRTKVGHASLTPPEWRIVAIPFLRRMRGRALFTEVLGRHVHGGLCGRNPIPTGISARSHRSYHTLPVGSSRFGPEKAC
jgi:hypothetical protein